MSDEIILNHINARLVMLRENLAETQRFGTNTPGFNQTLGAIDELQMLLDVIAEGGDGPLFTGSIP